MAREFGLGVFAQQSPGNFVFEDARGSIRRDLSMATMGDALRIEGGIARITDALAGTLGKRLLFEHAVTNVDEDVNAVTVSGDSFSFRAERAILALPPRLAQGLGVGVRDAPTWMAGRAKFIARYTEPFWRNAGLNGDAISHGGPLVEIHDASPRTGTDGALFGFAVPGAARHADFQSASIGQLVRLFGAEAADPIDVFVKDWSQDPATATAADLAPPTAHPVYQPQLVTKRLLFAGSENARLNGGFLEGALEAAEAAYQQLIGVPA